MFAAQACPDHEPYRQLLAGACLPEELLERLAAHLEGCPSCVEAVRRLMAGADTFPEGVSRACPPPPAGEEDVVARLIERLRQLAPSSVLADTPGPEVESGADDLTALLTPPQAPGEIGRLGQYRVLRVIGQGGMGIVLEAEDARLQRAVALKVMKPALTASGKARERFSAEARAMAAVQHDHIAPVYHVGEERGVPFLAMPLLKGEPLEARLRREGKLPPADAVRIAREVALGLAAAHARGLIHRDVKPANIWLEGEPGASATGGDPGPAYRVKLLDFGLARAVQADTRLTQSGALVGTPAYMAPEQARGEEADGRADLFSLGCVLYQMLTGRPPFRGKDVMSTLLAVMSEQPEPPLQINPEVPPALNNLVLRLLAKNLPDRPASAQAVARELAALQARPAQANAPRPPAAGAPAPSRPRRRWRLPVAVAAGLLLLAGAGFLPQPILVRIFNKDGKEVGRLEGPPGGSVEVVQPGKPAVRFPNPDAKAKAGPAPKALPELPKTTPLSPRALVTRPAKLDGVRNWTVETRLPRRMVVPAWWYWPRVLAVSPDSRQLAVASGDGVIRVWGLEGRRLEKALLTGQDAFVVALNWSPDGKTLAAGTDTGLVLFWGADSGFAQKVPKLDNGVSDLAWSADGKYLAIRAGGLRLWQVETSQLLPPLPVPNGPFAWSPDGKALAVGNGKDIQVFDLASRKTLRTLKGHEGTVTALAWSPNGKHLASASGWAGAGDGTVRFWDAVRGTAGAVFGGKAPAQARPGWRVDDIGLALAWSPDSRVVAVGGNDPSWNWSPPHVALLDPASGQKQQLWTGAQVDTRCLAWSRDGKFLAAGASTCLHVYQAPTFDFKKLRFTLTAPASGRSSPVVWAPDGRRFFFGAYAWDLAAAKPLATLEAYHKGVAWSADGRLMATRPPQGGAVSVRESDKWTPLVTLQDQGNGPVALSPDGKLAAVGSGKAVQVWSLLTGKQEHTLEGHSRQVVALAWSPDGKALASADAASGPQDGEVRLWDTQTWAGRPLEKALGELVRGLAWSADGRKVAAVTYVGLWAWRAADGELLRKVRPGSMAGGGWSPDGKSLLCASADGAVHRYELGSLSSRDMFKLPQTDHSYFSPDGRLLASTPSGWSSALYFYETASGRPLGTLVVLREGAWLAISPDGHYRGSPGIEKEIVYVVQTDKGQETLSPEEFAKRYNWKNNPDKVRLSPP